MIFLAQARQDKTSTGNDCQACNSFQSRPVDIIMTFYDQQLGTAKQNLFLDPMRIFITHRTIWFAQLHASYKLSLPLAMLPQPGSLILSRIV